MGSRQKSMAHATRGDHTERSNSERERQIPYCHLYVDSKICTNEPICERETDSDNKQQGPTI